MQILLFLFSVDIDMKKDIESLIAEERADIILKYATVSLHCHLCFCSCLGRRVLTWFILGLTKTQKDKNSNVFLCLLCVQHISACVEDNKRVCVWVDVSMLAKCINNMLCNNMFMPAVRCLGERRPQILIVTAVETNIKSSH